MSSANRTDPALHPGMVNKWTRDDLPTISAIAPIAADPKSYVYFAVSIALDAVVDRLNKDFPKSYDRGGLRGSTWLERDRDEAVARAIEAEPADPVEERAKELWEVAQGDGPFIVWEALNHQERTRFCRMAAHVLGQEDRHVDQ